MLEVTMRECTWRLDSIGTELVSSAMNEQCEILSIPTDGCGIASDGLRPDPRARAVGSVRRWDQAIRTWVRARLRGVVGSSVEFESIVNDFAGIIATTDNPAFIEVALVRAVKLTTSVGRIELIGDPSITGEGGDGCNDVKWDHVEIPKAMVMIQNQHAQFELDLQCGAWSNGRVRVWSRTDVQLPLPIETTRRLNTLCTMAACALEVVTRRIESRWQQGPVHAGSLPGAEPTRTGTSAKSTMQPSTPLHDATFLNAVLPFAVSQAQRHREPLSLLCVAIDRLSGIQDLFGRLTIERLVRQLGDTVASLIRASDIVARLDDDRVVVVLPRAPDEGAVHVARKICRAFAEKSQRDPELPGMTVSIGVATFPSSGDNVYSLFEAADIALAEAQSQGRNHSVVAPPAPRPGPLQRSGAASPP
jgi:diguanylate cyclase (GGDEF)-like protein